MCWIHKFLLFQNSNETQRRPRMDMARSPQRDNPPTPQHPRTPTEALEIRSLKFRFFRTAGTCARGPANGKFHPMLTQLVAIRISLDFLVESTATASTKSNYFLFWKFATSESEYSHPRSLERSFRKADPWRGLVRKSATISPVDSYSTTTFPCSTWSEMK